MAASLLIKLQEDLATAMKAHDSTRVELLRFVIAAVKKYEIDTYPPSTGSLTQDDVVKVLQKQTKQHRESIEAYQKGNRPELVEKEKTQLAIVDSYLPKGLTDTQIRGIVQEIISGEKDFGKVMGLVMKKVAGRANGNQVAVIVKSVFSQ